MMPVFASALLHAEGEAVGVGAAFLIDGFVYAFVAAAAAAQLVRNCCRYRPWTVQKMIHLLMFFATLSTLDLVCVVRLLLPMDIAALPTSAYISGPRARCPLWCSL